LSTGCAAHRIAYIDAGRIVGLGNPGRPMALGGRYVALATQQNS
jgi:hypothetical protein